MPVSVPVCILAAPVLCQYHISTAAKLGGLLAGLIHKRGIEPITHVLHRRKVMSHKQNGNTSTTAAVTAAATTISTAGAGAAIAISATTATAGFTNAVRTTTTAGGGSAITATAAAAAAAATATTATTKTTTSTTASATTTITTTATTTTTLFSSLAMSKYLQVQRQPSLLSLYLHRRWGFKRSRQAPHRGLTPISSLKRELLNWELAMPYTSGLEALPTKKR